MPAPYDYLGLMGGADNIGGIGANIQHTLLGQQQVQNNQNVLAQQARADAAREAMARILMRDQGGQAPGQSPVPGGGLVATPEQQAQTAQLEAQYPNAPKYAPGHGVVSDPDSADLAIIAQADPAAAQQIIRQRQLKVATAQLMANPTPQNIGRYGMAFPEALKDWKSAWEMMDAGQKQAGLRTSADVYSLLNNGADEEAVQVLQQHMEAAGQTGEDVSAYPHLIDIIRTNPKAARALAGINLSLGMGHDKFAETFGKLGDEARADELQPAKVQEAQANAQIKGVEAQYAVPKAESDLATAAAQRTRWASETANEVARLALDRDKLTLDKDTLASNIQLELERLSQSGSKLDPGAQQVVNQAVGNQQSAQALAGRASDLADKIHGTSMTSGWMSSAREAWKGSFGTQDPVSALRAEFNQLANSQAVKNLPPGPASDKDIALAKQGFPPANANKAYLESFLRGMAKMQQAVAEAEGRKAAWVSVNGSLGTARTDIDVGGVKVPAGTTFGEFNGNSVRRSKQGQIPASLEGILQKYGGH